MLKRLYYGKPFDPRLSADEARELVHRYARAQGIDPSTMTDAYVGEVNGRLVWFVAEPAIGSILIAQVDDATGEVSDLHRRPGR